MSSWFTLSELEKEVFLEVSKEIARERARARKASEVTHG